MSDCPESYCPAIKTEEIDDLIDECDETEGKGTDLLLVVLLTIIGIMGIAILLGIARYWMVAGYGP